RTPIDDLAHRRGKQTHRWVSLPATGYWLLLRTQHSALRTHNAILAPLALAHNSPHATLAHGMESRAGRAPFSCMEVAMPSSSFSRISRTASLLAVLGFSLLLYGCSDMITFAQHDREVGVDLYNRGDYAKAAGAFRWALRQDPRGYMSNYYLGSSAVRIHNLQRALGALLM